jgi:lysophospholipase L1-like esterase
MIMGLFIDLAIARGRIIKLLVIASLVIICSCSQDHPRVLVIGDSLSFHLAIALQDMGHEVVNQAIPGATTESWKGELSHALASRPNIVFIMLGVNDIYGQKRTAHNTLLNYLSILQQIEKDPRVKIYVQTTLPIDLGDAWASAEIVELNDGLKACAYGYYVVDTYSLFACNNALCKDLTVDGVHLTDQGYKRWAKKVARLLN